jgi:hypothetical protein
MQTAEVTLLIALVVPRTAETTLQLEITALAMKKEVIG